MTDAVLLLWPCFLVALCLPTVMTFLLLQLVPFALPAPAGTVCAWYRVRFGESVVRTAPTCLGMFPVPPFGSGGSSALLVAVAVGQSCGVRWVYDHSVMPQNFIACDRAQSMLLPPDLTDWVPDDHVVWSVLGLLSRWI